MQLGKSKLSSMLGEENLVGMEGEDREKEEMGGERRKQGPWPSKLYVQCQEVRTL